MDEKTIMMLDDERFPVVPDTVTWTQETCRGLPYERAVQGDTLWLIARTVPTAKALVQTFGCPCEIMFDHDLGTEENGFTFAKWLVELDMDRNKDVIPPNFTFYIQSQNFGGGRDNIDLYLKQYLETR